MSERVYLPTTPAGLRILLDEGRLPVPTQFFTAPQESEEGEYAALMAAAGVCAALLDGPGRRAVVVAEVESTDTLTEHPVPMKRVVAVHLDPVARPADADPDEDLAWYAVQELAHHL